ncbi:MAG: hypothetical protein ACSHWU_10325 [Marinicella sp.]
MKLFLLLSLLILGLAICILLTQKSLPITISDKDYVCTLSECKYSVTVKNESDSNHLAYLLISGFTTGTKYKPARKVKQRHEITLNEYETKVIQDQITIPMVRAIYFQVGVTNESQN